MPKSERRTGLIGCGLILLAVLVQVQATFQLGGTAVRVNAADIFLAVLGPLILFAFFKNYSRLIAIAGTQLLGLVVAASVLLSFSLFLGYEAISVLSTWAVVKYAGWYVLLFYLALGALIAIVVGPAEKELFSFGFVGFQIAMFTAFIAFMITGYDWSVNEGGRFTGFAGNPNAMALYLLCGVAVALAYLRCADLSSGRRSAVLGAASILLAAILFTKSIAALIALVPVLLFAAIIRATTLKRLAQVVALGVAIWFAPQVISASGPLVGSVTGKLSDIISAGTASELEERDAGRYEIRYNATVQVRLDGYRDALVMWRDNPIFGVGLGVYLHGQSLEEKSEILVLQIHNTALWLLTETGLAGFLAMAGIFIVLFYKVWRLARSPPAGTESEHWFQSAVLLILVGWAVMSLFHELMYQRIIWLLVGMALTAPVEPLRFWKRNQASEEIARR